MGQPPTTHLPTPGEPQEPPVQIAPRPLAYGLGVVINDAGQAFVGLKLWSEVGEFTFYLDCESADAMGIGLIEQADKGDDMEKEAATKMARVQLQSVPGGLITPSGVGELTLP